MASRRKFLPVGGATAGTLAIAGGGTRNVEEEERLIISDFPIGSDLLENYPNGPKQVTYRARAEARGSPFATFWGSASAEITATMRT